MKDAQNELDSAFEVVENVPKLTEAELLAARQNAVRRILAECNRLERDNTQS